MAEYTIHCAGFEEAPSALISVVLGLAERALDHSWSIDESEGVVSDVVMIHVDGENALQLIAAYQNFDDYRLILVGEDLPADYQDYWFLEKREESPPSLKLLVSLLNQVGACLVEAEVSESVEAEVSEPVEAEASELVEAEVSEPEENSVLAAVEIQKPIEIEFLNSDDVKKIELAEKIDLMLEIDVASSVQKKTVRLNHDLDVKNFFFGVLLQVREHKKYTVITLNKLPSLYLAPEEGLYHFFGSEDELLMYCLAAPKKLSVKSLSRAKFNKQVSAQGKEWHKSFVSLLSYAITQLSQGELLSGQNTQQTFILQKTAELNEACFLSKYHRISQFMCEQETNLLDTADQLKLPLADIFDFYNVCFLLGYINVIVDDVEKPDKNSKTLGRYLKSFFKK
ncbi:MAG: hypothetical protein GQ582_07350 [Methyloprofundus sp.]|nr:hypothetical protein [Methyloprofundus sp.]